jgi:hypothetical protein
MLSAVLAVCGVSLVAQQVPDRFYRPPIENPAYPTGRGPVVCVDEAHTNFHALGMDSGPSVSWYAATGM